MLNSLLLAALLALEACNGIPIDNYWLNYILTVEKPVTLAANHAVIRQNGSCCNPEDVTECTMCPDDPNIEYKLAVCFRSGFAKGHATDSSYCPLGGSTFTPNLQNGVPHLLAHLEAANLPRDYPGAVQMYVQIIATVSGRSVLVDDVFVYGHWIPADGTFRRIMYLSSKQTALVGANVAVNCTNSARARDCSLSDGVEQELVPLVAATTTTTSTTSTTASAPEIATQQAKINSSGQNSTDKADITVDDMQTSTTAASCQLNCTADSDGPKLSLCMGVGLAAGSSLAILLSILLSFITCCLYKNSMKKVRFQRRSTDELAPLGNPNVKRYNELEEEPQYEEIGQILI